MKKRILLYVPNQTLAMSVSLSKDLFWIASVYASQQSTHSESQPEQVIQLVSLDGNPVQCSSGNVLSVDLSLNDIKDFKDIGVILLCAFWGSAQQIIEENQPLYPFLQQAHEQNIPIVGISNGPYFMAEAHLLDQKQATVYPMVRDNFAKRYPNVNISEEKAITNAGQLYCTNGIPSSCDLMVTLIEQLYGAAIARQISKEFLLGFNRDYSLSNIEFDGQKYHGDQDVLNAQHHLEQHFTQRISVETLAAHLNMSPRNLSRRFKLATGESPSQYLQRLRIEHAKNELINTSRSIAEIAYEVGYDDVSHFSKLFNKHEGCTPQAYRNDVQP